MENLWSLIENIYKELTMNPGAYSIEIYAFLQVASCHCEIRWTIIWSPLCKICCNKMMIWYPIKDQVITMILLK